MRLLRGLANAALINALGRIAELRLDGGELLRPLLLSTFMTEEA